MGEENDKANSVVKNTEKLLQEKSLLDFIVRIEDVELPCHRVILAASSHFFRALLMTDMKEAKEGCVTINGISLDIFQLILKSMYTGKITLTIDNCMDLWQAADQLQIDFIVENCADFATKVTTVENFEDMWKIAEFFNSEKLSDFLDTFLLANFDSICELDPRVVLGLGFNDFDYFIDSHELNVRNEDWLIKLVLKWVEYVPEKDKIEDDEETLTDSQENTSKEISCNDETDKRFTVVRKDDLNKNPNKRLQRLASLLQSVRTCLVSSPMLKHLLKHRLIINNTEARDILIDAVLYKTTHYNHGQWRTSAIHRASSEWQHCGVVYTIGLGFVILNTQDFKFHTCVDCSELRLEVTLAVFDSYLYAAGVKDDEEENSSLFVFSGNSWNKITEIPRRRLVLVPYDDCIFILSKKSTEIYRIFPKCGNPKVEEFTNLPDSTKVRHAISYRRMILIFSSVIVENEDKTAVHKLDILTKKLSTVEQLNGPAKYLISFSHDNNTFVLQKRGDLWTIQMKNGKVTFQLLGQWQTPHKLHGALTLDDRLIVSYPGIFKKPCEQLSVFPDMLKDYFCQFAVWNLLDYACSNLIPVVLHKDVLIPV
ncbi:uncharacterized protein LOC131952766 [Physella acuta]|uniref:uncharacterized protein LOC131952766 n=1 Tax=Physella acuta TaxID=109671 RepID=UPI0027DD0A21|nr:uncharacterized protein LOC131952766 [Physella acuta]XP_059171584.1 uncharacterized protein LOC131952766 [Physella acuta]